MTLDQLASCGWGEVPLPLMLGDVQEELCLEQLLRHLPGRRIAARASWQGRRVFVKLFFGKAEEAEREQRQLVFLRKHGLPVPELLEYSELPVGQLLITEWLEAKSVQQQPLEDILPGIIELVRQLVELGLQQEDLHLDNFLFCEGKPWLIDTGAIRAICMSQSADKAMLDSLVMLCGQLPLHQTAKGLELIAQAMPNLSGAKFAQRVRNFQHKRIRRMMKKWQRASSAIALKRLPKAVLLKDRSLPEASAQRLLAAIENPKSLPIIKQGSKITLYRFEGWIIKHYFHTSLKTRLKRLFFGGRADISWKQGWTLEQLGIPTPRPVMLLRFFDSQEVIVFPRLEGQSLGQLLEEGATDQHPAAQRASYWLDLMHAQGLWHGDTKAFNCLLDKAGDAWWIDLDAAGHSRFDVISRFFIRRDEKRWRQNLE